MNWYFEQEPPGQLLGFRGKTLDGTWEVLIVPEWENTEIFDSRKMSAEVMESKIRRVELTRKDYEAILTVIFPEGSAYTGVKPVCP